MTMSGFRNVQFCANAAFKIASYFDEDNCQQNDDSHTHAQDKIQHNLLQVFYKQKEKTNILAKYNEH